MCVCVDVWGKRRDGHFGKRRHFVSDRVEVQKLDVSPHGELVKSHTAHIRGTYLLSSLRKDVPCSSLLGETDSCAAISEKLKEDLLSNGTPWQPPSLSEIPDESSMVPSSWNSLVSSASVCCCLCLCLPFAQLPSLCSHCIRKRLFLCCQVSARSFGRTSSSGFVVYGD